VISNLSWLLCCSFQCWNGGMLFFKRFDKAALLNDRLILTSHRLASASRGDSLWRVFAGGRFNKCRNNVFEHLLANNPEFDQPREVRNFNSSYKRRQLTKESLSNHYRRGVHCFHKGNCCAERMGNGNIGQLTALKGGLSWRVVEKLLRRRCSVAMRWLQSQLT
jgi:hypothetical protein